MPMRRANAARVFLYCLLISAAAMLICSESSPLYPLNDWADANVFFTMGKGMLRGKVLYRDLYDHKGPLLYGLHALCALVSGTSFLGVYLLETLSFSLFLFGSYKIFDLFGIKRAGFLLLPALAACVLTSLSFQSGDSAEELCLPLMVCSMYLLLRYMKSVYPEPPGFGASFLQGLAAGCALLIKFTVAGFFAGTGLMLVCLCLYKKSFRGALAVIVGYASGAILPALPWTAYFAINGAADDFLKAYIYDNIFLYGGESLTMLARAKGILKCLRDSLLQNPGFTWMVALGLIWAAFSRHVTPREKIAIWLSGGLMTLGVFWGGKQYLYYGFALAAFAPMGLIPIGLLLERFVPARVPGRLIKTAACAAVFALSLLCCRVFGKNTGELLTPYEETMQYKLRSKAVITESTTMLNYGFLDAGFYLAFDVVPSYKYFCQTNVPLPEMLSEQKRYIDEGLVEYVVTRSDSVEGISENYELVATAESPPGFWYDNVYLYRLKN